MAEKNSMDWSTKQVLEEAMDDCKKDDPDALMVIFLWNQKGKYNSRFLQCGMRVSEMIALLEVQKDRLLKLMEEGVKEENHE
jgi:hypothetical protein